MSKRKAFKEKLKGYLEASNTSPEKLQLWFWDESGFSMRVIRRKGWVKKGTRKKVTGQRITGVKKSGTKWTAFLGYLLATQTVRVVRGWNDS